MCVCVCVCMRLCVFMCVRETPCLRLPFACTFLWCTLLSCVRCVSSACDWGCACAGTPRHKNTVGSLRGKSEGEQKGQVAGETKWPACRAPIVGKKPTRSPGRSCRLLRHSRYSAMLSMVRIRACVQGYTEVHLYCQFRRSDAVHWQRHTGP